MAYFLTLFLVLGFQDKPVVKVTSLRSEKTEVKVGETFRVFFELEIPQGWYIYPAKGTITGRPTTFKFEGAEVAGAVEEPKPKLKKDEVVGDYEYHESNIRLTVPVRLKPGPKPGPFELKGKVVYQICSDVCIDGSTSFSLKLSVREGVVAVTTAEDLEYARRGFFGLILLGMLGGLISLLMPCTYPLIPITLTYFVKQAAGSRTHGLLLSTIYSLGIILTFTGLGFVLTLALGPGGARIFAANPWVNIIVGMLFLWFTGSLFG